VIKTARPLYQCWLSCKDAFPSPDTKDEWVVGVWNEACFRIKEHPNLLPQDEEACPFFIICGPASLGFQFTCSSMTFLTDMKTKVKHAVEFSYEFDTSQAPKSISRNASRAQALLAKMTFIYRVRLITSPFAAKRTITWVIGVQFWRTPTSSISTPHNPESCRYHVVPE
jgi:hypothetical protein